MYRTHLWTLLAVGLAFGPLFAIHAQAEDWPQFRGQGGRGQSQATDVPISWDAQTNLVWKTDLPGPGASSPTTYGDRIYLTCYTGYGADAREPGNSGDLQRNLLCVNRANGQIIWNTGEKATNPQKDYQGFIALHGYASGTPVIDDDAIYVFYGATGAAAYSHEGERLWLTNCGTGTHGFGTGSSPALFEDLVFINASVESGALIALNKKTGQEVWRQEGMDMSWCTPSLVQTAGGDWELVVNVKGKIFGFAPATGQKLWTCEGIPDYICPSVLVQDDVLFAIGGRKNTTIAIRSGGRGDVSATHKLWEQRKGSNVSSPVYHDGHLYWASEGRGIVYCADAKTGELVYEERLSPNPGKIYASPVFADGKLYYVSREDGAFVLPAEPRYEVLSHNSIDTDDSIFNGSPVISDGQILLRSDTCLYCYGK